MFLKRKPLASHLGSTSRRRFIGMLGAALASPLIPAHVKFGAREVAFGQAWAEEQSGLEPTYFIEINMRDQWDFGQVFVAPGLATKNDLRRGSSGRRCALYYRQDQLTLRDGVYLTPESMALAPHVSDVAMIETCELTMGRIHGHEAANALRSPGRGYSGGPGRMKMYEGEPGFHEQGNEAHYSSTPTPATLHNYWQKQNHAGTRNGIAFKGISRAHTTYHFGAGLPGAELDRFQNRSSLFDSFPSSVEDFNIVASPDEAELLARVLKRADAAHLTRRGLGAAGLADHDAQVTSARDIVWAGEPRVFDLELTPEERAHWSAGVPAQQCNPNNAKANIWEQCAWAAKLVSHDMVRSVALEFDYVDVHDSRTEEQMRIMTLQAALPLARLIDHLKLAGVWDRTVIAMYSLDGGRSPAAGSAGNEGKNTIVLAGGKIRGGYYGDVRAPETSGDGHRYAFHRPNLMTGAPIQNGAMDNGKRLEAKHVWRTTMRAAGVPDSVCTQFPDARDGQVLDWLLRA